jgi:TPR repeat protein
MQRVIVASLSLFFLNACAPDVPDAELIADETLKEGVEAAQRGDYAEAYWLWRPLADAGMARAQHQIGWLYANGNGLRVNLEAAIQWWTRAARSGHADSAFAIGMAYLNGEPGELEQDFAKASEWLVRSADAGSADAPEILNRLVSARTDALLEAHPGLLERQWLGTPVVVSGDEAELRAAPNPKSKALASVAPGTELRQVATDAGWSLVVLPDQSGLAWVPASAVQSPGPALP